MANDPERSEGTKNFVKRRVSLVHLCNHGIMNSMKRKFRAIRADMTIWFRSFLLLILMAQAAGCRREDPTTWNVSVAGPLAYG